MALLTPPDEGPDPHRSMPITNSGCPVLTGSVAKTRNFGGPKFRMPQELVGGPIFVVHPGPPMPAQRSPARCDRLGCQCEGTLDRFPGLKVIAAHGGGFLPSYADRSDHACLVGPKGCNPDVKLKKAPTISQAAKSAFPNCLPLSHTPAGTKPDQKTTSHSAAPSRTRSVVRAELLSRSAACCFWLSHYFLFAVFIEVSSCIARSRRLAARFS